MIRWQAAEEKAAKESATSDRPVVISEPQTPAASPEAEAESGVCVALECGCKYNHDCKNDYKNKNDAIYGPRFP